MTKVIFFSLKLPFCIKYNMKRIHLKKKRKIKLINLLSILFLTIIIILIILFIYIGKILTPKVKNYSEQKSKKIISLVLSNSINDDVIKLFENNNFIITDKNEDGSVSSIDFNSSVVNKALSMVSKNVKKSLEQLEKGELDNLGLSDNSLFNVSEKELKNGIIYEVPSGIIFNNALLANIGPKIPVKLIFLGDIKTDIVTNTTDYGINNVIIEIGIKISISEQVILPYDTNQIEVETTIPVAIKLIQGTVPNYYFNGKENPSIAIQGSNK